MGLDMYLYRKTYVKNWEFMKPNELTQVTVTKNGEPIPHIEQDKICYITEEVAYWRKANAIHQWFVDNCQRGNDDCGEYYVSIEQLETLVNMCEQVIANPMSASKVLPTQGGFFFGSTDYDEYYMEDLKLTVSQLKPLLNTDETQFSYYYHSSW